MIVMIVFKPFIIQEKMRHFTYTSKSISSFLFSFSPAVCWGSSAPPAQITSQFISTGNLHIQTFPLTNATPHNEKEHLFRKIKYTVKKHGL